jgi:hypothetical protein
MQEAILQGMLYKEEADHLPGTMFRLVRADQIHTEVREAILFHQEEAIHPVHMEVLHQAAVLLHLIAAGLLRDLYQEVLILQDLPQDLHQVLHQALHQVAEVHLLAAGN